MSEEVDEEQRPGAMGPKPLALFFNNALCAYTQDGQAFVLELYQRDPVDGIETCVGRFITTPKTLASFKDTMVRNVERYESEHGPILTMVAGVHGPLT